MIIGHEHSLQFLQKAFENKKVPHALFFWGPAGLGKKTIAEGFARSFFCEKERFFGCGSCTVCDANNPIQRSHILRISAIKQDLNAAERGVGIEIIREIQSRLDTTSLVGKPRVILFENAAEITAESWHALLKTVEEPPPDTYIIIIGESKESIPSTILSRMVPIRFSLIPQKKLFDYLEKHHPALSREETEKLAGFAQGRPGRLIQALADPDRVKDTQKKYSFIFGLFTNPLYTSLQKIEELVKVDGNFEEQCELMFMTLRSILLLHTCQKPPYVLKIPESNATMLKNRYHAADCIRIFRKLFKTHQLMRETNVNRRIAFEALMLDI